MQLVNEKVYVVKSGDTLSEIANHFCGNPVTRFRIAEDNGIVNVGLIYPGQRIWIRGEFLKKEFKSNSTPLNPEPFRKGQVVFVSPSGILTRPGLVDLCRNSEPLSDGYFSIVQVTDQNQRSVLVQDNKNRSFYFNLNESREVVSIQGAVEVSPGRFMPFN